MKIALFGASGWIGGTVTREALERDHIVTAIVRNPSALQIHHPSLTAVAADVTDPSAVAVVVAGHDAVVAAIGGRKEGRHEIAPAAVRALLVGLPRAGVDRLVWVGGAGSLEVVPGVRLIDTPLFPAKYRGEALAQVQALEIFLASDQRVAWTVLSPPKDLEQGERTGRYRTGGDLVFTDDKGDMRISVADYAVALVDELDRPAHVRRRFTVAY